MGTQLGHHPREEEGGEKSNQRKEVQLHRCFQKRAQLASNDIDLQEEGIHRDLSNREGSGNGIRLLLDCDPFPRCKDQLQLHQGRCAEHDIQVQEERERVHANAGWL